LNSSRGNRSKSKAPKRQEDDWHIPALDPREQRNFLAGGESLEQQEDTKKDGNDAGPDHREHTENEDERDRRQRMVDELALFCGHEVLLRMRSNYRPAHYIREWVRRGSHIDAPQTTRNTTSQYLFDAER
jgi:hypothetical protein